MKATHNGGNVKLFRIFSRYFTKPEAPVPDTKWRGVKDAIRSERLKQLETHAGFVPAILAHLDREYRLGPEGQ